MKYFIRYSKFIFRERSRSRERSRRRSKSRSRERSERKSRDKKKSHKKDKDDSDWAQYTQLSYKNEDRSSTSNQECKKILKKNWMNPNKEIKHKIDFDEIILL